MNARLIMSIVTLFSFGIVSSAFGKSLSADEDLAQFLSAGEKYQVILNVKDESLAKRICSVVENSLYELVKSRNSKCYYGSAPVSANRFNRYSLEFSDGNSGEIDLNFSLNHKKNDDFESLKWTLLDTKSEKFDSFISSTVSKIVEFDSHGEVMKDLLFYHGLLSSERLRPTINGMFDVIDNGKIVGTVNKDIAKIQFMQESKRNRNFLRAGIEVATFLGIGKAAYMMSHDSMKEDWDFNNTTMDDFKNRLFTKDQMKFDDNTVGMNWGHAYAGVLYYSSARNNGFSSFESLLVTIAASSTWEYLGEYKEVVSINDQIVTGLGGAIIGETLYQISNMLKSKDSMAAKIIGASINPVGTINDLLDGKGLFYAHENFTRRLGFNSNGYSHMDIVAGVQLVTNDKERTQKTLVDFGFNSEVINLPVSGVGNIQSIVYDTTLAELIANGAISEAGLEDWHMVTKLALGGYFSKNVTKDNSGNLRGHTFLIAPAARTEYRGRGVENKDDFFAVVNVLGATMDMSYYYKGTKIRFAVDIYGDFAFVRPYGLDKFTENGGNIDNAKSVLAKRGYYYATGITNTMSLSIENGKNGFGIRYVQHNFESIEGTGLNRHEENVTDDYSMKDKYRSVKVYYTRSFSEKYNVTLALERIFREGSMTSINTGENVIDRSDIEDRIWLSFEMPL